MIFYQNRRVASIPFDLLGAVFQCLALLSLVISVIYPFGRVKRNLDIIDLKKRIGMLLDVAEAAGIMTNLARRPRAFPPGFEGKFLLVVEKDDAEEEKYEAAEEKPMDVNEKIAELKSEMDIMKMEMRYEISNLESRLESKIDGVKREITNLRVAIQEMLSGATELKTIETTE